MSLNAYRRPTLAEKIEAQAEKVLEAEAKEESKKKQGRGLKENKKK